MREEAHEIRTEIGHLTQEVNRLRERVLNLQKHFGQANEDVATDPQLDREGGSPRRADRIARVR